MLDWLLNWQHQNCRSRQRCWCGRELASARAGFALTPWAAEGGVIVHVPPLPVDHLCVCPPVLLQCTVVQVVTLAGMQHSTFPGTAVCKVGSQPGAHATHWHGLPGTRSGARARCSVSAHGLLQGCAKIHCTTTHRLVPQHFSVQNRRTTPPRERRNELGGVRGITPGKDLRLSCSRKCAASACIVCRRCLPFSSRVRHCSGGADLRPGQVPRCAEGGSWLRSCQAGAFVGGGRRGIASCRR